MAMTRRALTDLGDELRGVARGKRKPSPRPAGPFLNALSAETLELLQALALRKPVTVGQLAEILGKAQSNVSRTLQRLAGHGLVRLVRAGREVRPELVSSEVKINLVKQTVEVCDEAA
jgi:predicted transcriptional regulator